MRNVEEIKNIRKLRQKELGLPNYTVLEEILNSVTHGIGALLAILAMVLLPIFSKKDVLTITSISIYAATLFILYIVSTLYHGLGLMKAKKIFRVLDHCSIFLLIAGTYTPICLLMIERVLGIIMLSIIWVSAITGVVLNSINVKKYAKVSLGCYLGMGWCAIFLLRSLFKSCGWEGLSLLILGGIAYTIGAVIYGTCKKIKFMHSLWHVFVIIGSVLHFFFIFNYVKTF